MPELPSGTVTFLFTDIEGSTALGDQDRAAMAVAVERHIALPDAAIHTHGGMRTWFLKRQPLHSLSHTNHTACHRKHGTQSPDRGSGNSRRQGDLLFFYS